MTVSLTSNFFANARGITFKDGGGVTWTINASTNELTATASGGSGSGTVTSVALADGSTAPIYAVTGSPVTTAGTLSLTLSVQSANKVFAGPTTGVAAQPTFRSMVLADLPLAIPLTNLAAEANNTVVGNVSGGSAVPVALTQTQVTALISNFTTALSGAAPASGGGTTNFLRADGTWAAPAYPTAANPAASVGLAAVNGTAVTFMRSDGAPALSVTIAPTWTGNHIFTPGAGVGITVNGVSGQNTLNIQGNVAVNSSFGLNVAAGTSASDFNSRFANAAGTTVLAELFGEGSFVLGNPTGGAKGLGTLNATNIFINGVAIGGLANPTASVGLSAVNGTATTAMRSDGAPALDVTITPTWTGKHIFTPTTGVPITVNAKLITDSGVVVNGLTAGQTVVEFQIATVTKGYFGFAGAAGQVITGSAAGDACLRTQGGTLRVSTDSGATTMLAVTGAAVQGKGATAAALVDMTPDTGTFTATQTGGTTSPTVAAVWARMGNVVVLTIPAFASMTSNSTALTITGMPAAIKPARTQGVATPNAGINDAGALISNVDAQVSSAGVITFLKANNAAGFTNSATTKGLLAPWTMTYQLN